VSLSDKKEKSKTVNRAVRAKYEHWSDKQKLEAAAMYLQLGNNDLVAATLGIGAQTLRNWRKTEWWDRTIAEMKMAENVQLSNRAKAIVEKGMVVMNDRLENGEWIYDQKKGELIRKPVGLREATVAVNTMLDKKLLLEKQEVQVVDAERLEDKLNKLMDSFASLSKPKKIQVTDVIIAGEAVKIDDEGDYDNALHEGWEEGLQEGEQAVQQPTGTNQGEIGTDNGTEGSE